MEASSRPIRACEADGDETPIVLVGDQGQTERVAQVEPAKGLTGETFSPLGGLYILFNGGPSRARSPGRAQSQSRLYSTWSC